ncbi:hypothetical protein [Salmonirosea aquatica]|uniref:Uncharacterized protein n=1 Tax=Salmonirosea aquatica TaxID=2654236 RepID=A0A7C9BEV0_9BACT|nr:hypothetical protein [Cytophagaceae bacterium SJW1-29]
MVEENFRVDKVQARQRLIFLLKNSMVKGKFELLYKLFHNEVKGLSLLGASKLISAELGIQVGIQTMRTLRIKCHEFENAKRKGLGRSSPFDPPFIQESDGGYLSNVKGMEDFRPMDVFAEIHGKSSPLIKWADKTNS